MAGLREKVTSIICEEWPKADNEVGSATIYQRLVSEGVEVSEDDLRRVLFQLADRRNIELAMAPTLLPSQGGMTIRGVRPELCR